MAFVEVARLFWTLAPKLAAQREPLAALPMKWTGTKSTRAMYRAMCEIPADISKEELERRIAVFGDGHYGISPDRDAARPRASATPHRRRSAKIDAPSIVPAEKVLEPA